MKNELHTGRQIPAYAEEVPLWMERCRPFLGLPLSFTKYSLYPNRIIIDSGFLTRRQEEIRLYRVMDVSLRQGLFQRLFRVGTVRLMTNDASVPQFLLRDIPKPQEFRHLLSELAESERNKMNVSFMECL